MNILIVDDDNDKIGRIILTIGEISKNFFVETVIDSISAQQKLRLNHYDILIVDLLLPLRESENPNPEGGKNLILEIERNNRLISPSYIIGITQFKEYLSGFSKIWNVLIYSPADTEWQDSLKQIINHITKVKKYQGEVNVIKKPTLFLEGKSDEVIFKEAIRILKPDLLSKISIESDNGASWVARQLIIWGKSLSKGSDGLYTKAIGIFDGDLAGDDGIAEVRRVIDNGSAGNTTFKIIQLAPKYAKELRILFHKGICIPTTLEEMFLPKYWLFAESKGWLQKRQDSDSFLKDPKGWNKFTQTLNDYFTSLELVEEESIYLNKFNPYYKEAFSKYILELSETEKIQAFQNFVLLINEIESYFNFDKS